MRKIYLQYLLWIYPTWIIANFYICEAKYHGKLEMEHGIKNKSGMFCKLKYDNVL